MARTRRSSSNRPSGTVVLSAGPAPGAPDGNASPREATESPGEAAESSRQAVELLLAELAPGSPSGIGQASTAILFPEAPPPWRLAIGTRVRWATRSARRLPAVLRFTGIARSGTYARRARKRAAPPVTTLTLRDEKKAHVLIAAHNAARESIARWEDRLFRGSLASAGAMLLAPGFLLQKPVPARVHGVLVTAMLLFGAFATLYLLLAARARAERCTDLAQIEAALGFSESGRYLRGRRLVGYRPRRTREWGALPLLVGHSVVWLFAVYALRASLAASFLPL
ncbi:MAG TPA: hypothetical protein VF092_10855 [Longimicrobium sp.]